MEPLDILRLIVALGGICVGLWFFMSAAVVGEFIVRRWLATERPPERAYYDPPAPPMRPDGDRALSLAIARVQQRRWALCASGRAVAVTLRRTEELWLLAQDQVAAGGHSALRQQIMGFLGMASPGAAAAATKAEPELRAAAEAAQAALVAADAALTTAMALPPEASGLPVTAAAPGASAALAQAHTPATVMPKSASAALAGSSTPITVIPASKSASAALAGAHTPITVMPTSKSAALAASATPTTVLPPAKAAGSALPAASPASGAPAPEWLAAEAAIAHAQAAADAACQRAETAAATLPRPNPLRMIIVLAIVLAAFGLMMWHDWAILLGHGPSQPGN